MIELQHNPRQAIYKGGDFSLITIPIPPYFAVCPTARLHYEENPVIADGRYRARVADSWHDLIAFVRGMTKK